MTDGVTNILDEVIVTPRRAFPRIPEVRVIERPGWLQIVTPSLATGGLNEVIHSALAPEHADAAIDEAIAIYRDLGLRFRWNAGPGSGPADLGDRLAARGLTASWGRGMARTIELDRDRDRDRDRDVERDRDRDVDPAGEQTAGHATTGDAVTVTLVDARTLADYTSVMALGWGADPVALAGLHRQLLAEDRQRMFVASCAGVPAAAASYQPFARSAFLMRGVVLPAFRGRGLYRRLVAARLAHARGLGIALATTHASEATSAPILEKLGFATACRFVMYFG